MERVYIFISHSHKDIDKVRVIRNYLESLNTEPILFFLLSLNDNDEINKLIKDEIAARIWFIFCNSKNSQASTWCKTEYEFAINYPKSNFFNIDLETAFDENLNLKDSVKQELYSVVNKIEQLHDSTFFSYSVQDENLAKDIIDKFNRYGFKTYSASKANYSDDLFSANFGEIEVEYDYLVYIIGDKVSKFSLFEVEQAMMNNKKVLLLLAGNKSKEFIDEINSLLFTPLSYNSFIAFDTKDIEKSTDKIIHYIFNNF